MKPVLLLALAALALSIQEASIGARAQALFPMGTCGTSPPRV